ncbi:dual specificity phosphatase, catalytic domain-containing protein [Hirsutella rhossiliensis]|uniref:protein-tyrosine-phosphatase n=1 Tax=Hirsutella rhossiliensis TaxID=111463 RepID=A0A9P8SMY1_9HYPO|nr:dual specificity phosphatase, catalytic domain-containing protein [Hirsutella rhossiliensis]KAH0967789.1 dual specificity phosphatase, catalytic domain-containing protein [Hirsutella rhossiliensis]
MALSRIQGHDGLYLGGIWALRRSDSLSDLGITHVLSLVDFNHSNLKNFKDEPWTEYGKAFRHLVIDVDDVDDTDLLVEMPRAVRFIDEALRGEAGADGASSQDEGGAALQGRMDTLQLQDAGNERKGGGGGAVFVHCAAGKSRSVAVTVAYLLWRYPGRFDPNLVPPGSCDLSARDRAASSSEKRGRRETASEAVRAALELIRRTRPMAEPNDGFMEQLALWWEMECPEDVEAHPVYQRWAYKREVEENVAVGQAPSRLRFEDEQQQSHGNDHDSTLPGPSLGFNLRCKKCRRTLATAPFIQTHSPAKLAAAEQPCPHHFVEPLSWMRGELEKGQLSGRLACPNERCAAGVGRYDWKGIRCACGAWVTPGLSLQRARVDEEVVAPAAMAGVDGRMRMGIRMPPGRGGNL